jgi:hypothetical protein
MQSANTEAIQRADRTTEVVGDPSQICVEQLTFDSENLTLGDYWPKASIGAAR